MNSEWFIFKGTHHIGPFSSSEIETMFKKGDINGTILIWKEGEKSWEPLIKVKVFQYLFNAKELSLNEINIDESEQAPPEIPPAVPVTAKNAPTPTKKKLPAPIKTNLNTVNKVSRQSIVDEDDELPPPIPVDAIAPISVAKHGDETVEMAMPEDIPIKVVQKKKFSGVKEQDYSKISLVVIAVIFVGIFVWQNLLQNKSEVHFKLRNIMPLYIEKLEGVASSVSPDPKFGMALSLDGKTLFVASNKSKEIDVALKLTPVKKRVLGSDDGIIFLRGKIYDHLGEFDKVYLPDGKEFSPGEYNYELHATEKHFVNTYFPAISSIKFFRNLNRKYTIDGNELIYSSSPKDFEIRLAKFKSDLFNQKAKPMLDHIERLNTVNALLDQMMMLFEETLNHIKDGKEMNKFIYVYSRNIAPVLQSLASDKDELRDVNDVVRATSAIYLNQIVPVTKMKKIKDAQKKNIIEASKKDAQSIREKVLSAKNNLELQMNAFKN